VAERLAAVGGGRRRGRDSNPRSGYPDSGFQDRCIRPLCHPSWGPRDGSWGRWHATGSAAAACAARPCSKIPQALRRGGRVAEGTRLLSEYGGKPLSRVRIPPSPFSTCRGRPGVAAGREVPATRRGRAGAVPPATLGHLAPVAQLDRASVYGTEGRGFEFLRARCEKSPDLQGFRFFVGALLAGFGKLATKRSCVSTAVGEKRADPAVRDLAEKLVRLTRGSASPDLNPVGIPDLLFAAIERRARESGPAATVGVATDAS
jgi:hypothetical protein